MPDLYIIAGPNGAGKTTVAMTLLPEFLGCYEFVNADEIARGLSPLNPGGAEMQAGRLMLQRIRQLSEENKSFAFETTLSTRSFAPFIKQQLEKGYEVRLVYIFLESTALAVSRVKKRVQKGGHSIPENIVQRRYQRSLINLLTLYLPLVSYWYIYNNSGSIPSLVALREGEGMPMIYEEETWKKIQAI